MASLRWILARPDPAAVEHLQQALTIPAPLAAVLVNRGLTEADAARHFLEPRLSTLADPFELPDMRPAVTRLLTALERRERIVIYGDYDVDGVTSSALLRRVLEAAGAEVDNFLPHRMDEGYGLSDEGIDRCLADHRPRLLIAVDCGTTAVAPIARLQQAGVDVIVLDHHDPPAELPRCAGVVNPARLRSAAGDVTATPLASVGVTFKFVHALLKERRDLASIIDLREHLDLVALGTVADLVPLVADNRVLVRAGLSRLTRSAKAGVQALCRVAGLDHDVSPGDVGYRLGPRLNAAGRLDTAMHALELLLAADNGRADELAGWLDGQNRERQGVQAQTLTEAQALLGEQGGGDQAHVTLLAREGWHPGVIGIVASRLLQDVYRPTIVIALENGVGKGSCRSIEGFSMVAALNQCADLLVKHGGHEMAAGLTIAADQLDAFRERFAAIARDQLQGRELTAPLKIDAPIRAGDLTPGFVEQLRRLEPCGMGNAAPCFVARGVRVPGVPRLLKEKHLKFRCADTTGDVEAIWWGGAARGLPGDRLDVAGIPEINRWRGTETVQLRVRDVRPAA